MGLLRILVWLAGFGCCTFIFVVLFEHGGSDMPTFLGGAREELHDLISFLREQTGT